MNSATIQIERATIVLTVDQIIAAVRQLEATDRAQVLRALHEDAHLLSVAALNSQAALAVWDNPADAAVYDSIAWSPPNGL